MSQCKAELKARDGSYYRCLGDDDHVGLHEDALGRSWDADDPLPDTVGVSQIVAVLERVEWANKDHDGRPLCALCHNWPEDGHLRCELADVLYGLIDSLVESGVTVQ